MLLDDAKRKELKQKYPEGSLTIITLPEKEGQGKEQFVFKKPDMKVISACASFTSSNPMKAATIMFNSLLVFGDKNAANDPDRFLSIAPELEKLVSIRTAQVEKL